MTKTGKKPRWIWNWFWSILLIFVTGFYIYSSCIIFGGLFTYQTEQIYEKYKSDHLYTNVDTYKITKNSERVEVDFSEFLEFVQHGDSINLTVSKISGELFEIQCDGKVLYKVSTAPTAAWAQQPVCLFLIGAIILMLIVVNIKNPKGFVKKWQEELNIS